MSKKYIKMNDNKKYLSLGNLFIIIKSIANNKESAMQVELFSTIFNINEINSTTVNNYCIGYRAIGIEYKKKFIDLYNNYKEDNNVFIDIIINIISILDEHIYKDKTIDFINKSESLKKVIDKCILLSNEDININESLRNKLEKLINEHDLYNSFIMILYYVILENKQPIYNQEMNIELDEELKEYLKINLYEGISYITSLKELAKKNNMYANAELGSLEFSGIVSGNKRIDKCFNYYINAAKKNHPKACFMVGNLILTNRVVGDKQVALNYINKAIELGSIAAINTMGNNYKSKNDIKKALEYYTKAIEYGYVYAYNNIGLIHEVNKEYEEALKYFKISADLNNSWALNKVGEYYRKNNNLIDAYTYYMNAIECPITERNYYAYYNLAKYYYLVGNKELNVEKDIEKAKEYLTIASNNGILEATVLLKELNK